MNSSFYVSGYQRYVGDNLFLIVTAWVIGIIGIIVGNDLLPIAKYPIWALSFIIIAAAIRRQILDSRNMKSVFSQVHDYFLNEKAVDLFKAGDALYERTSKGNRGTEQARALAREISVSLALDFTVKQINSLLSGFNCKVEYLEVYERPPEGGGKYKVPRMSEFPIGEVILSYKVAGFINPNVPYKPIIYPITVWKLDC